MGRWLARVAQTTETSAQEAHNCGMGSQPLVYEAVVCVGGEGTWITTGVLIFFVKSCFDIIVCRLRYCVDVPLSL